MSDNRYDLISYYQQMVRMRPETPEEKAAADKVKADLAAKFAKGRDKALNKLAASIKPSPDLDDEL